MKTIVKILFGSHLYGTNTKDSDLDYKGVALPTWEQIATGTIPKHKENHSTGSNNSKNSSDDVDTEIYSLHEFIKLAVEGQTVAMDMLHAPQLFCEVYHPSWDYIISLREKFYSKKINSFLSYAIGQAAKYGIKGSRLNAAKEVIEFLSAFNPDSKLKDCDLSRFPLSEHVQYVPEKEGIVGQIDVCGKKLQYTSKVGYCLDIVDKFYKNYGDRARKAAQDEGIDWKAISHAFRAAFQMKELFTEGTITFPRPEAEFLKQIKTGKLKYNSIAPKLEDLVDEVKVLKDKSSFPEEPDYEFWKEVTIWIVEDYIM